MTRILCCRDFSQPVERSRLVVLQRRSTEESWGLKISTSEDGLFIQELQVPHLQTRGLCFSAAVFGLEAIAIRCISAAVFGVFNQSLRQRSLRVSAVPAGQRINGELADQRIS